MMDTEKNEPHRAKQTLRMQRLRLQREQMVAAPHAPGIREQKIRDRTIRYAKKLGPWLQ
jgi:hypothetical protein